MTDWKVTEVLDWEAFIGTAKGGLDIAIVHRASTFADHYDAQYDGLCISDEEWQSLVRLVAAAPELLALLKRLVQYSDEYPTGGYHMNDVIRQCHAVIAKAEGRATPCVPTEG